MSDLREKLSKAMWEHDNSCDTVVNDVLRVITEALPKEIEEDPHQDLTCGEHGCYKAGYEDCLTDIKKILGGK